MEKYKQIIDISYEAVVCAVNTLAHTAIIVRNNLGKLQNSSRGNFSNILRRIIDELVDAIDSLITRSKNAPLYAHTWGLPIMVFTEASRIDDYRAYDLVKRIAMCSLPDENMVLYRNKDGGERLEFLSSTNFGYALHLGILAHVINGLIKEKLVAIDKDEIGSIQDLLSVVKEYSRDVVFESFVLEALSMVSKIVPALLNTLSDKYEDITRKPREELPCILRELSQDLCFLVGSIETG